MRRSSERGLDRIGRRVLCAAVSLAVVAGVVVGTATPAGAAVAVAAAPTVPSAVQVGQTFPVSVALQNTSTPPDTGPVSLTDIRLVPACDGSSPACTAETGVFTLPTSAVGSGPASCAGTWAVTESPAGTYTLVPPGGGGTLSLAVGEVCTVSSTALVSRVPTTDAGPAAGVQTYARASATGISSGGLSTTGSSATVITVAKATPTLTTSVFSSEVPVGGTGFDRATLAAPAAPSSDDGAAPTGTITFDLFGPADPTCTGTPVHTSTANVSSFGLHTSQSTTFGAAGTYRWVARYSGDANYAAVSGACGDADETVTAGVSAPAITTSATPTAKVAEPITDTATLSGTVAGAGTIVFSLYGPDDATCARPAVFTSTKTVTGNGAVTSDPFLPAAPGTYRWAAAYSGNTLNVAVASPCNAPGETTVVSPATVPAIAVTNTPSPTGLFEPGGVFTYAVVVTNAGAGALTIQTLSDDIYGDLVTRPSSTCSTAPGTVLATAGDTYTCGFVGEFTGSAGAIRTSTVTVTATATEGTVQHSDPATVSISALPSGTCSVIRVALDSAIASIDQLINAFPQHAGVLLAQRAVLVAQRDAMLIAGGCVASISTQASPSVNVGGEIWDVAAITLGGTGTVTFDLYGPDAPTCTGTPIFTDTQAIAAGSATSLRYTATQAGTYRWVARYSGDASNPARVHPCGSPNESVEVTKHATTISTQASPNVTIGGAVSDTATLASGGPALTGTVTFALHGPGDDDCSEPAVFTSSPTVTGTTVSSGPHTPLAPGSYRWVATYSGDAAHHGATSPCGSPNESVEVAKAVPLLATEATPATVTIGGSVADRATVTGGYSPTGSIAFALYGPDDDDCSGPAVFTDTQPLVGGTALSASHTPVTVGTYRWIATYSGDVNNEVVAGACGDAGETAIVQPAKTTLTVEPVLLDIRAFRVTFGSLSARLTTGDPAVGVSGQTIVFRTRLTNQEVCRATTDADGRARCTLTLAQALNVLLNVGVRATYAGNGNLLPSSAIRGLV